MMNAAFDQVIAASDADRRDVFLAAARRLGTAVTHVEPGADRVHVRTAIDAVFRREADAFTAQPTSTVGTSSCHRPPDRV